MKIRIFWSTLALALLVSVSTQAQIPGVEVDSFKVELLSRSIDETYDIREFDVKPDVPEDSCIEFKAHPHKGIKQTWDFLKFLFQTP